MLWHTGCKGLVWLFRRTHLLRVDFDERIQADVYLDARSILVDELQSKAHTWYLYCTYAILEP